MKVRRITRIPDIAERAGVSTATVDRVLNSRANVSEATTQRVLQARAELASFGPETAPRRDYRLKVILPAEAGPSTEYLGGRFQTAGSRAGVKTACTFAPKMHPESLARELLACREAKVDAVAFQALDDPRVRDAVTALSSDGIPSLALLSDLGGSRAIGYVGVDNRAAGRTAGYLMGRFMPPGAKVAIIWGGQLYRSHEAREIGFRTVLRSDFPDTRVIDDISGRDDIEGNYHEVSKLLAADKEVLGIYSVGGGNEGIVRALKEAGREHEIALIGHNLTAKTRAYLLDRSMDAVIHQDMDTAASAAVNALVSYLEEDFRHPEYLGIEIVTRENLVAASAETEL